MTLTQWGSTAELIESVATTMALILGGIWTYLLFVTKREKFPRAKISNSITILGMVNGQRIVRVTVLVENLGNVLLELVSGKVTVKSVKPAPPEWARHLACGKSLERTPELEYKWPTLESFPLGWEDGGYIIEPREDQGFNFDLLVDGSVRGIEVYSYIKDVSERKRELGWNKTTVHELEPIGGTMSVKKNDTPIRPTAPAPKGPPKSEEEKDEKKGS